MVQIVSIYSLNLNIIITVRVKNRNMRRYKYEQAQKYYVGKAKNRDSEGTWCLRIVATEGWGSVTSRDCGNMVKKAIEIAEKNMK